MRARSLAAARSPKDGRERRPLEAPLYADAEVLQPEESGRVARQRFGADRPVRREPVAAEEGERPRLEVPFARAGERHAEVRALPESVRPAHARSRREAVDVAPLVGGKAKTVVLGS